MRGTLLFKLLHPVRDEGEGFRARTGQLILPRLSDMSRARK